MFLRSPLAPLARIPEWLRSRARRADPRPLRLGLGAVLIVLSQLAAGSARADELLQPAWVTASGILGLARSAQVQQPRPLDVAILSLRDGPQATSPMTDPPSLLESSHREASTPVLRPSRSSGFLNLNAFHERSREASGTAHARSARTRLELEGAMNLSGWVLESRAASIEPRSGSGHRDLARLTLGDTRLVHDLTDWRARIELGDVRFATSGFQRADAVRGVAVTTRFELQPFRRFTPSGRQEFSLERPSTVEVRVNGGSIKSFELAPGRYDLRDFELGSGINDVRVRVRDSLGQVRELEFGLAFEPTLLAPGTHQFSYAIGLPQRVEANRVRYPKQRPTISAFHKTGISDAFTAGLNLQADEFRTTLGTEGTWATTLGTLRADLALSRSRERHSDLAARLRYDHVDLSPANATHRVVSITLESRSQHFASLGPRATISNPPLEVSARLEQDVLTSMRGAVELRHARGRVPGSDRSSVMLWLKRRLTERLGGSIDAEWSLERCWSGGSERQLRSILQLTWTAAQSGQSMHFRQDSRTRESAVDWTRAPVDQTRGWGAHTGLVRTPSQDRLAGDLRFEGERFEVEAHQGSRFDLESHRHVGSRSSVRIGTAIAYAGGVFAWSEPIEKSFVILESSEPGLPLLHRVVPGLEPYQPIALEAASLGGNLGGDLPRVHPAYKSGAVLSSPSARTR